MKTYCNPLDLGYRYQHMKGSLSLTSCGAAGSSRMLLL